MFKLNKLFLVLTILVFSITSCGNKQENRPFTVAIVADFQSLSPGVDVGALSKSVLGNMNGYLYKYNTDTKLHEPSIATSIEQNEDSFTIHIRDDVYFHNDTKVTTEDIIYSIKRNAGLVEDFLSFDSNLKNTITEDSFFVIDDTTIEIKVSPEFINNANLFALYNTIIVPKNYTESEQAVNPISAGPYKFSSYKAGNEIVFTKYDKAFEPVESIEKVVFKIISDNSASIFALQNKEIDYLALSAEDLTLFENDKNVNITKGLSNNTNTLFINTTLEEFKDPEIIKAIKYAINSEELIEITSKGFGKPQASLLSPYQDNYYNKNLSENEFDPKLAKTILENKGYSENNKLKFTLKVVTENKVTVNMANLVKSYLADCYIDVTVQEVPWSTYFDDVYMNKQFDATILQLAGYDDPSKTLRFFKTGYVGNLSGYSNEEYDNLTEQIFVETDEHKKIELFYEAQNIIFNDCPSIFLGDEGKFVGLNSKYTNLKFYPYWNIDIAKIKEIE